MAGTTNFGPVTVNPGTRVFGPTALADTDTQINLSFDRTVAGGFNDTPAVTATISFEQSNDGGNTWQELCEASFPGGVFTNHNGQVNVSGIGTSLLPGTGRQGRAIVVTSGSAVAVQGSLVIS